MSGTRTLAKNFPVGAQWVGGMESLWIELDLDRCHLVGIWGDRVKTQTLCCALEHIPYFSIALSLVNGL